MARELVCHLPLPPKALSPNISSHWGSKAKATRGCRHDAWVAFLNARPKDWPAGEDLGPVEVDIEYRCARKVEGYIAFDGANALAACKAYIDGMVDAKVARNDSSKRLHIANMDLYTRKTDKPFRERGPGVTFTVRLQ